jgi:hypothetical protein
LPSKSGISAILLQGNPMIRKLALAAAAAAALSGTALAAREPNREELSRIEAALRAESFTRWDDIEMNADGQWEVEDAVAADGRSYDLKLDKDLRVIDRKLD